MKSAYEIALERMESQGIERPSEEALSDEIRQSMAEARRRAKARLAELEILHRDGLARTPDPDARAEAEEGYQRDRRRVEERLAAELARLRGGG